METSKQAIVVCMNLAQVFIFVIFLSLLGIHLKRHNASICMFNKCTIVLLGSAILFTQIITVSIILTGNTPSFLIDTLFVIYTS